MRDFCDAICDGCKFTDGSECHGYEEECRSRIFHLAIVKGIPCFDSICNGRYDQNYCEGLTQVVKILENEVLTASKNQ